MDTIRIATKNNETFSAVSNFFIDYYMTEANGEFVKIYLYLVRLLQGNRAVTVADIADHFNLTQKDICRAIKYWIKQDVLQLEYNSEQVLTGITLLPLEAKAQTEQDDITLSLLGVESKKESKKARETDSKEEENASNKQTAKTAAKASTSIDEELEASAKEIREQQKVPAKVKYTSDFINEKKADDDFGTIIYQMEVYFERPMSQTDTNILLYIFEELHFSSELLEYLIEFCVSIGKKSCHYMEKVAIDWYEQGINTISQAKVAAKNHNKAYLTVVKELGIPKRTPTIDETQYIDTWYNKYAFDEEIIKEACRRAVLSKPHSANFPYVNGILTDWHEKNVRKLSDIQALDEAWEKEKKKKKTSGGTASANQFNNYQNTTSDATIDELENLFLKETNKKKS